VTPQTTRLDARRQETLSRTRWPEWRWSNVPPRTTCSYSDIVGSAPLGSYVCLWNVGVLPEGTIVSMGTSLSLSGTRSIPLDVNTTSQPVNAPRMPRTVAPLTPSISTTTSVSGRSVS